MEIGGELGLSGIKVGEHHARLNVAHDVCQNELVASDFSFIHRSIHPSIFMISLHTLLVPLRLQEERDWIQVSLSASFCSACLVKGETHEISKFGI
jgi:hypothetical protein